MGSRFFIDRRRDRLEYYVLVSDNDGVNGAKNSKSAVYRFELPNKEDIEQEIEKSRQNTESQLDRNIEAVQKKSAKN